MTKQEILDYFSLIDFAYNESGRYDSLSRMLDELLKEQEQTIENLNETVKNLLQQIADIKEYMTPNGRVGDVQAVAELLKKQEAVEPTLIREGRNKHYNDYVCPRCDNEVVYEQNYCSECGVRFLWEGR